jgi:hypothetical protein
MHSMALVLRQRECLTHREWKMNFSDALATAGVAAVVTLDPALTVG